MTLASTHPLSPAEITEKTAELLYAKATQRHWLREAWTLIRGQKAAKLDLLPKAKTASRAASQPCRINIQHIVGSSNQGRTRDFTADFRPTNGRTKARWLSIAKARQQGKQLPPVQLVQKGNQYFVEDGHHRISVAVALGDQTIDALISSPTYMR